MQSKAICTIGWPWRPLRFLCGSLFVGLKWMKWIGLLSKFGATCETEGYLRLINSFSFWLQMRIIIWLFKILVFVKYCVTQNWGDILKFNVYVNRHSFLFLKTSCDTLDLKLKVKWNLSNIHTGCAPFTRVTCTSPTDKY